MFEAKTKKYEEIEDPGIRAFLIAGAAFYPADAVELSISEQRAYYDSYCAHFRRARPESIETKDLTFASVSCRHYSTRQSPGVPVLLYFHGGGHVVGGLDSHDDVCAEIADGAAIDVISVDYRLAPEHPFPAAFEDGWAVLQAVANAHSPIIIGGDSSGGNLAAALALKARDSGGPALAGQVLIYPGLGGDTTRGSFISQANAPGLTTADILYYRKIYDGRGSKFAEPLRETDYGGLPPAFIVVAGLDPEHDDGCEYAARLDEAGIPADVRDEPLLVHGFLRARNMSVPARASFDAITAACASLAHHGRLA